MCGRRCWCNGRFLASVGRQPHDCFHSGCACRKSWGLRPTLARTAEVQNMPVRVQIPTPMRQHTDGLATVEVTGATVQGVLDALGAKYPGITQRLFDNGQVRRFVNLNLNDEDVRYLE